jgi:tetratricopeptide (TPR) repeat protein
MNKDSRRVLEQLTDVIHTFDMGSGPYFLTGEAESAVDWLKNRDVDELTRLKICCMYAEIFDYAGQYQSAREVIEADGRRSESILRNGLPESEEERLLLKQRVWVVIHWAMTFYRAHHYERARQLFLLCKEALEKRVVTEADPSAWTLSRIYYSLGLVQRQVYDYSSAREWFGKSIEEAQRSFKHRTDNLEVTNPIYQNTRRLTDFYVSKSLALGLAWTYYTEGQLLLASALVVTARYLLASTNEDVIRRYVEVVCGSIMAAQGNRPEAIKIFKEAYDTFDEHEAYRIRAANELAVVYVHEFTRFLKSGDLRKSRECEIEARRYIKEVKDFAISHSDIRWECNALIAESRLLRALGEYRAAEEVATEALDTGGQQRFIRIDACIARGEARLNLEEFDEACEDFNRARADSLDNPKVQAVCHLHLCRAYIGKDDNRRALQHRDEAARNLKHVDNKFVLDLEREVAGMMEKTTGGDFRIRFSESTLEPRKLEKEFRAFLARWAEHQAGTNTDPWKLLGVSKQTFYTWRLDGDSDRKSRKTRRLGRGNKQS